MMENDLELMQAKRERLFDELQQLDTAIDVEICKPEQWKFDYYREACWSVEEHLEAIASNDCEGSYNCGNPTYTQGFYVGDDLYLGTLSVEYGREQKKFYFIEQSDFKAEKV